MCEGREPIRSKKQKLGDYILFSKGSCAQMWALELQQGCQELRKVQSQNATEGTETLFCNRQMQSEDLTAVRAVTVGVEQAISMRSLCPHQGLCWCPSIYCKFPLLWTTWMRWCFPRVQIQRKSKNIKEYQRYMKSELSKWKDMKSNRRWHPMAPNGIRWHPMASDGIRWHDWTVLSSCYLLYHITVRSLSLLVATC